MVAGGGATKLLELVIVLFNAIALLVVFGVVHDEFVLGERPEITG